MHNPSRGIATLVAGLSAAAVMTVGFAAPAQAAAPKTITLWTHNAGNPAEMAIDQAMMDAFNKSQKQYKVVAQKFPQIAYNDAVTAAAAAGKLPCIIDVDGPVAPGWAWAGYIAPLTLPKATTDKFLSSVKTVYNGKLYAIGHYDAAIGLFSTKTALNAIGARVATVDKPWTLAEYNDALAKFKASGKYKFAISLGTGWDGEWYPYAFSPMLQAFGGDLVNRNGYQTAEGVLNGRAAKAWGTWFQGLFTKGYAEKKESGGREGFLEGTAALMWNGSWAAGDAMKKYGDDLVVMPPPNLGKGAFIGGASWQWAVTASCKDKAGAMAYLKSTLDPKYQVRFAQELNNIPATEAALAKSKNFAKGSVMNTLAQISKKYAKVRPVTPAYPVIAKVFEKATKDIIAGADVQNALDAAVDEIDKNIADNNGYKSKK